MLFAFLISAVFAHISSETGSKEVLFYVFSDIYNFVNGPTQAQGSAVQAWDGHKKWTASIPGAVWIWDSEKVKEPESKETVVFTNFFAVEGKVQSAVLDIAADHAVWVRINGKKTECFRHESSFTRETQFKCDVGKYVEVDLNKIEFKVSNGPAGINDDENPAGLLYRLTILTLV
jgi:hypothetical protein